VSSTPGHTQHLYHLQPPPSIPFCGLDIHKRPTNPDTAPSLNNPPCPPPPPKNAPLTCYPHPPWAPAPAPAASSDPVSSTPGHTQHGFQPLSIPHSFLALDAPDACCSIPYTTHPHTLPSPPPPQNALLTCFPHPPWAPAPALAASSGPVSSTPGQTQHLHGSRSRCTYCSKHSSSSSISASQDGTNNTQRHSCCTYCSNS
jgi:hypothetical protein